MDLDFRMVPNRFIKRVVAFVAVYLPSLCGMRILFVGSPCSEGAVGLIPGCGLAEVLPALLPAVRFYAGQTGARVIVFKDLPENYSQSFDPWCAPGGLVKAVSYPGTRLALTGAGFDRYLLSLNSARRYKLRKKLSRSRELIDLRGEIIRHPDAAVVNDVFALYEQTYAKAEIRFERLTADFFRLMAKEDRAYFVLLRNSGNAKLVAFMLCFHLGSRVVNKFVGLDYETTHDSFVYFRLYEHAIDWASRVGASEFYSGQNTYSAKLDLGHTLVPLDNYFEHLSPWLHRLFARVARRITWSRLDQELNAYVQAHPESANGMRPSYRPLSQT